MFKKKIKTLLLATVVVVGAIGLVGCNGKAEKDDTFKVSLILDEGGVNDKSFNESAWNGALDAKEKYKVDVNYFESKQTSDYFSNIETAVDEEADLIIGVGYKLADTIKEASDNYPDTKFAIIDGTYDKIPENVQPILFNEEQSGYSVGLIAGKMTKSNKLGFVGGMEVPSVTNFLVGFEKGVKEVNPNANIVSQYANSFSDASKGKAISKQMVQNGADIIFTAGGGVNSGVFETANESGVKAIGVDMPSNQISPETIITSALKNVGTGVELTIKDLVEGNFKGGQAKMFDFSNNGVGYEQTKHLTPDLMEFVNTKIKNYK